MKTSEMLDKSLSFDQLELTMKQRGLPKTKAFIINVQQARRYHHQSVVYGYCVESEELINKSILAEQHANYYRWQALIYANYEFKTGIDLVDGYHDLMNQLFEQYGSMKQAPIGKLKLIIIMLDNQILRTDQIQNRSLQYDKK